jgi:hypothetical protein
MYKEICKRIDFLTIEKKWTFNEKKQFFSIQHLDDVSEEEFLALQYLCLNSDFTYGGQIDNV